MIDNRTIFQNMETPRLGAELSSGNDVKTFNSRPQNQVTDCYYQIIWSVNQQESSVYYLVGTI